MYIHTSKTVSIWSCKLLMILEKMAWHILKTEAQLGLVPAELISSKTCSFHIQDNGKSKSMKLPGNSTSSWQTYRLIWQWHNGSVHNFKDMWCDHSLFSLPRLTWSELVHNIYIVGQRMNLILLCFIFCYVAQQCHLTVAHLQPLAACLFNTYSRMKVGQIY